MTQILVTLTDTDDGLQISVSRDADDATAVERAIGDFIETRVMPDVVDTVEKALHDIHALKN